MANKSSLKPYKVGEVYPVGKEGLTVSSNKLLSSDTLSPQGSCSTAVSSNRACSYKKLYIYLPTGGVAYDHLRSFEALKVW